MDAYALLKGGDEDLHSFLKGSPENPFEILQSRSGNPNALLKAMEPCGWRYCPRVGMWLAIHSEKVNLVMSIPWGVVRISIDFLRVRMDIPCIACEWGSWKVLMRIP